jgi:hypothetical protein
VTLVRVVGISVLEEAAAVELPVINAGVDGAAEDSGVFEAGGGLKEFGGGMEE